MILYGTKLTMERFKIPTVSKLPVDVQDIVLETIEKEQHNPLLQ